MSEVEVVFKEEEKLERRRGALEIIVKILSIASRGARKTKIVYTANLNFTEGKRYLNFLLAKGLLTEDSLSGTKKIYRTTKKGKMFMKLYRKAVDLIE